MIKNINMEKFMKIKQAIESAADRFPFPDYIGGLGTIESYESIAEIILENVAPGSIILDFGSGPCDKAAIIQALGYKVSACDDLNDDWHLEGDNRAKILKFADESGVDFSLIEGDSLNFKPESFDAIMLCDVLEHLHNSPKQLLESLLIFLKPRGKLIITVPNAVNIRKRICVIAGKTNLPDYHDFFFSQPPWRGHVREYVKDDLKKLAEYLSIEVLQLKGCDHMITKVPARIRFIYRAITNIFDSLKDTLLLVAIKKTGN